MNFQETFTKIYNSNVWGGNISSDFNGESGEGSSVEFSVEYIRFFTKFYKGKRY